ncbi:hypothetical protein Cfla_0616 [Cellulomonas flavigena DSM 20109]|uniref:Uncharacterized protein n=1 Tax=Cellulomonas flavigena (strain ATCC 482 / DSM 20109 / BCRC 11376 / JCM 18109 / NBRC 3775 / NCIMB 8073 / NRS 134) TaxID=446466 RepID=D5UIM9_CELFN|nr:hypothetical protein Cfla_0616 [Cellulomonas flavigena DSM 20109]
MALTSSIDPATIAAWVRATTAAQGLPEKVTDTTVLADVAVMLATGNGWRRAHGAPAPSTPPLVPAASRPPVRDDAPGIEPTPATLRRRQYRRAG